MAADGLADLHATHVVLGGVAHDLALADDLAVQEAHIGRLPVHVGHYAVRCDLVAAVCLKARVSARVVDGVAHAKAPDHLLDAPTREHALVLDHRHGRLVLAHDHVLQVEVAVCGPHVAQLEALDLDALHKPLVVGVEGVQLIDQVVDGRATAIAQDRGRIAQAEQWVEAADAVLRGLAAHLLRLVLNDDGTVGGDDVDGPAALEAVLLFKDLAGILVLGALLHGGVERLHVDDHAADAIVLGEGIKIV